MSESDQGSTGIRWTPLARATAAVAIVATAGSVGLLVFGAVVQLAS